MATTIIDIGKLVSITTPEPVFNNNEPVGIAQQSAITPDRVGQYDMSDYPTMNMFGTAQVAPLSIKLASDKSGNWYTFPVEPMISISGGNNVIVRNVAKMPVTPSVPRRGTIKERWQEQDYTITIDGKLTTIQNPLSYPADQMAEMLQYLESREALDVKCPLFAPLKINGIVITKFDFPFTKGIENQEFHIEALSDDAWDLLIKVKNFNT